MKSLSKVMLAGCGALAMMATAASADIVCNAEGDCWHARVRHAYRPEFGVRVYPDSWRWGNGEHYRWREHEGRGYWRNGLWIGF